MKPEINLVNFSELRSEALQKREDKERQGEALSDILLLRSFALENNMHDEVVELLFEEALIHQHRYMEGQSGSDLAQMKGAITKVNQYVQERKLFKWESRVARYLGRIADYEGKYEEAIRFYKEAIEKVELDPKYESNKAMDYEYRGFLIADELRVADTGVAVVKALNLYEEYETTEKGRVLKQKDYTTWAIWRSAVLINLCNGLIGLGKMEEYEGNMKEWLNEAEKNFVVPDGVKVWADFGFRKNEIEKIRKILNEAKING